MIAGETLALFPDKLADAGQGRRRRRIVFVKPNPKLCSKKPFVG